tara:strand:- start:2226 stop:3758 length:1533 start_codon:yes stop_codon:yes gene_type:complete
MTYVKSNKFKNKLQKNLDDNKNIKKSNFKPVFINQEKNFANKHGFHYRSSAQFYFLINNAKKINTNIILFNYFQIKNNNKVAICVTLRDAKGNFVDRKNIDFENQSVINIDGRFWDIEFHSGSIEIEYFSLKNLVIPYAAVIGAYETDSGITYVHTYSRNYSKHEMENGFTVMESCESNWTIRDSKDVESFTILHNGFLKIDEQEIKIKITSESGRILEKSHVLKALNPYEIIEIVPQKFFLDLPHWLNSEQANCSITFKINGAFTRTLVGNRTKSISDMQVTHSNFAYNHHETDFVDTDQGYMCYPNFNIKEGQINIYPDMPEGEYFVSYDLNKKETKKFNSGRYISYKINNQQNFDVILGKVNSTLPSRVPIGISGKSFNASKKILPFEISLGICTKVRPAKRLWWGPLGNTETKNSLVLGLLNDIYGEHIKGDICLRIFNDQNNQYKELIYTKEQLISMNYRLELGKDALKDINKFGMYTVYSDYPGFFVYSLTENKNGSVAIEHGF